MSDYNKPNIDAANDGSLAGQLDASIQSYFLNEFEGMLPAVVVSYDDTTNKATIKPLVMMGTTDGAKVARSQVSGIPVFRFGGGGFFMRFPIKPGDHGWIKSNDRDISLVFQRGGLEDWPNTERLNKFSDAMFFPDTFKQWVISGENADKAVWQTMDGETCISLGTGEIKHKVGSVSITVSASGIALVSPPGTLTHNGKNIGDTHAHVGSPTAPLGPVSNTGVPI